MKESVWVETLGCREFAKISWKETQCPSPIYASLVSNGQRMFIFLPACNLQGIWLPVRARPVLLRIAVIVFRILVAVVLLNLLVAQLNMAYKLAHADMEGYARLTRAGIIVTTVEQVSRKRWRKFLERLGITWLWLEDAQRISKDLLCLFVRWLRCFCDVERSVCVCNIWTDVKLLFSDFVSSSITAGGQEPTCLSVLPNEDQTAWGCKRTCKIDSGFFSNDEGLSRELQYRLIQIYLFSRTWQRAKPRTLAGQPFFPLFP